MANISFTKMVLRFSVIILIMSSDVVSAHVGHAPRDSVNEPTSTSELIGESTTFNAVVRATCNRQIVLLGENGFHGEGRTLAFKVRLVEHLVSHCGFRIILFEASQYEFLNIKRRSGLGDAVTEEQISAAIGQIWNRNDEVNGLISFLTSETNRGGFIVGGLDDQLGSRGLLFGNDGMIAELSELLSESTRQSCSDRLLRRTYSNYSSDDPYSPEIRDALQMCVADMRQALESQPSASNRSFLLAMIDNISRNLERDFQPDGLRNAGRALSMYMNFLWWLDHRGAVEAKVIVWAANSHVAKGTGIDPLYEDGAPLGHLIAADFGRRAFSLGFSAVSGSYRWSRSENRDIPSRDDSLESRAIGANQDIAFLAGRTLGRRPEYSGLLNHQFYRAPWRRFFDGVVVFRSERPPNRRN